MSLPPSSPRLPSPPPPTEIQIGPQSPSIGNGSGSQETALEQGILDANAARRIHPGTKAADMAPGPPLVSLMELDSAFQLQEHLKALHYHHTKPTDGTHSTVPITRRTAAIIASPPNGVDRNLWLYELCRFLINKCNDLIVGFLFDTPPCSSQTCPEMRASEWQFLCAVHETPKSCCAIDYCCHTLDWATNIVTSQKIFPSRLSLGNGDGMEDRGQGVKHLENIFRRLHRIFAHAWFQHREVFWRVEGQTGLYVLFKTVCDNYELLPAENYKLPPEAEGLEPIEDMKPAIKVLKPETNQQPKTEEEDQSFHEPARNPTNTRRHIRSSPSTGSAVTTVLEADEDDTDVTQKLEDMHIAETDAELVEAAEPLPKEDTEQEIEAEAQPLDPTDSGEQERYVEAATDKANPEAPDPFAEEAAEAISHSEDDVEANPDEEASIPVIIEDETHPKLKDDENESDV